MMNSSNFTSESGDKFYIPKEQYETEVAQYRAAVECGDEDTMLNFEEGATGWEYIE
jgi:hypothetical protein